MVQMGDSDRSNPPIAYESASNRVAVTKYRMSRWEVNSYRRNRNISRRMKMLERAEMVPMVLLIPSKAWQYVSWKMQVSLEFI